ncbi:MAG TPA: hemolysin family protein [Spirochaetota bacterium]|nr:hemolysin family protein [Spirochaetota bacterium]
MGSIISDLLFLVLFLLLSGFFSGSETAFFSLKKSDLHHFSISKKRNEKAVSGLMKNPENILITILIGNLFVNLISSAMLTRILLVFFKQYGHFISIAVLTPVIIILCEIFPKIISINSNIAVAKSVVGPLSVIHRFLFPIRYILVGFSNIVIHFLNLKIDDTAGITKEELDMVITYGKDEGLLNKEESNFMKNVLKFSQKEAMNVMIPRTKAVFIPIDCTISKAIKIFKETGAVRAPVYRDDIDTVVGVLDSRELIPYVRGYKKAKTIRGLIHDMTHYPATKGLDELLSDFLRKKIQIAIVVDEYGGTQGVVTLSSIVSELLGENEVWEKVSKPAIRKVDNHSWIIPGNLQIDDYNDYFEENIQTKETETIGGYITEVLGCFPEKNTEILEGKYILRVKLIRKNRIESVEIIKRS